MYWLVTNPEGHYLAGICGTVMHWVQSANDVPAEQRYCTFMRAKSVWLRLRELPSLEEAGLSVQPVDFYAHRSSPTSWAALDD